MTGPGGRENGDSSQSISQPIKQMVQLVWDEVTAPGLDQRRGYWRERGDCCLGSRLARALGVESGSYLDGVDEWARRMGLSRVEVAAMLQDAGAGHDPIGPAPWPDHPIRVWRRLARLEQPPGLIRRDLRELNLAGTGMSGLTLRDALLDRANLRDADLNGADLGFASLREAELRNSDLRCANLSGADLTGADLTGADLRKANLRGADITMTRLAGARIEGTGLSRRMAEIEAEMAAMLEAQMEAMPKTIPARPFQARQYQYNRNTG